MIGSEKTEAQRYLDSSASEENMSRPLTVPPFQQATLGHWRLGEVEMGYIPLRAK